jgi:hypothetical protein
LVVNKQHFVGFNQYRVTLKMVYAMFAETIKTSNIRRGVYSRVEVSQQLLNCCHDGRMKKRKQKRREMKKKTRT